MASPLPDRETCLRLMDASAMPDNIRGHSLLVARLAVGLGRRLGEVGVALDLDLVEAIALLHDLGKARGLETGEHHGEVGAAMVEEAGYPAVAPGIRAHTILLAEELEGPLTESLLVNYADKRVRHDELVSLGERFEDLGARYARSEEALAFLEALRALYVKLEASIFDRLGTSPDDLDLA